MTTTALVTWATAGLAAVTFGALRVVEAFGSYDGIRAVRNVMRGAVLTLGLIALASPVAFGEGWAQFSAWRVERFNDEWREVWEDIAPTITPEPAGEPNE